MPNPTILVFLKAPQPGAVKTRLASDLGNQTACDVYRHLALATLKQIPENWPTRIYFSPADAREEMRQWLGNSVSLHPQSEGNLGKRLTAACQESFADGAESVILLGGDCPTITTEHLHLAAQALEKKQPVIGPAKDGGYWLLGLYKHSPKIFEDICWSSETVFHSTMERFSTLNLHPTQLETLEDIDDLDSLNRAIPHCQNLNQFLSST